MDALSRGLGPPKNGCGISALLESMLHVKNSLSRVKGLTPEQAVFGKMSGLPGSIAIDEEAKLGRRAC